MKKIFSTLIIAGLFVSGCASKGVVKETSQPQQKATQQEQIKDKVAEKKVSQGTVASKEAAKTADLDSHRLIREMQVKMKAYAICG